MKRIFSGIQPTNILHIGNYLGALKNWVALQSDGMDPESSVSAGTSPDGSSGRTECVYCIVDLHAITVPQDPKILKEKILETAALFIACGVDPDKATLFVQSSRPEHSELAWILNCYTGMGELKRMTQFKDKSGENQDSVSVGLFDYPVLMAADILLYQTTHVPVGEDQKQHIEITRDIAQRFNNKYSPKATPRVAANAGDETFTIPEPIIKTSTARIMALDDPTKKMSKSSPSPASYIALTDSPEIIKDKIKRAVTDSGTEIKAGPEKPALTNLLNIFAGMTGREVAEIEKEFEGKGYGEFKSALAEAIITELKPIQDKFNSLMADQNALRKILSDGSAKIAPIAQKTLKDVKSKVGLG